jgi:hypothetical protein
VRITDALSGTHLWAAQLRRFAGRYLRPQDKVVVSVVGVIQPTLQAAEIRRSGERPASDLAAYDLYLRALRILLLWQRGGILTARDLLGQAIDVIRVTGARLGTLQLATSRWILTVGPRTGDESRKGVDFARQALDPLATTLVSSATHPRFGAQLAIRYRSSNSQAQARVK